MVRSNVIMSLYQTEANEHPNILSEFDDLETLNQINLTQFILDTEPELGLRKTVFRFRFPIFSSKVLNPN